MARIKTQKSDIVWNYIGTILSMSSGFVLLPLLMHYLSSDELGLWYVYVALSNFALLFEFGFSPTFARNIIYVISGARRLSAEGCDTASVEDGIDWHLLNTVIKASKVIYAIISLTVTALLLTVGSVYVSYITIGMDPIVIWGSWVLFCFSVFLNLYFLWATTVLRGYGDVAGEKKALVVSKITQLALSAMLLVAGCGLMGAAGGYLASSVMLRLSTIIFIRKHKKFNEGRLSDSRSVKASAIKEILFTILHIAWRDGVVQIALYASTQAMSILSSLFLGLSETGTYSVYLQFSNAICSFATAYPNSYFPAMQSAYAEDDQLAQRRYVSTGITGYWALAIAGTVGVCLVFLPLLPFLRQDISVNVPLFIALSLYLALLNQHSLCCCYIVGMNEIPYMFGYISAAVFGCVFVYFFCNAFAMGAWGIVLGQALSQLIYNNWKWPKYLCCKLGFSYRECLQEGLSVWKRDLYERIFYLTHRS